MQTSQKKTENITCLALQSCWSLETIHRVATVLRKMDVFTN